MKISLLVLPLISLGALFSLSGFKLTPHKRFCHAEQSVLIDKQKPCNIFIGTGLWSHQYGLTTGLPIDVLAMLISAEHSRISIEEATKIKNQTIILIADHLAQACGADAKIVQNRAHQHKKMLKEITYVLGISNVEIMLSSDMLHNADYKTIHEELSQNKAITALNLTHAQENYVITQTAIGKYLNAHKQVGVKIGWAHTLKKAPVSFDEAWFDSIYINALGNKGLQFLYTKPGRASQKSGGGPRSPYTHTPSKRRSSDMRLVFHDAENHTVVERKDIQQMSKPSLRLYKNIIEGIIDLRLKPMLCKPQDSKHDNIVKDLNSIICLTQKLFDSKELSSVQQKEHMELKTTEKQHE